MVRALVVPIALLLAVTATGCPDESSRPAAPSAEQAVDQAGPGKRPGAGLPLQRPKAQSKAEVREAATAFRKALREGRELSEQKQLPQAMEAFERAVAANGQDPRAHCELGWVAFQADDLDRATASLDASLAILARMEARGLKDPEKSVYAGCLYNRGRVAEARSDVTLAAKLYRDSLALRPNATVQGRLDGLGAAAAQPAATAQAIEPEPPRDCWVGDCEVVSAATLEDLERELARRHCAFTGAAECAAGGEGITIDGGAGGLSSAAVVRTESYTDSWGQELRAWVALRTASGWHSPGQVAYTSASGVGGTSCELTVEAFRFVQAIEGGASEVWVEVTQERTDSDMGVNAFYIDTLRNLTICGLDGERPACWGLLPVAAVQATEASVPPEELSEDERAEIRRIMGGDFPTPERNAWSVRAELVPPDRLRLVLAEGTAPADLVLEERPVREMAQLRRPPEVAPPP
jgi:hypothetical protein